MAREVLIQFATLCTACEVPTPAPIARALELIDAAYACESEPTELLELELAEVPDVVANLAIRRHDSREHIGEIGKDGLNVGVRAFSEAIVKEARDASLPYLDNLVEGLRPRFDEAAQVLTTAATRYGFTMETRSDDVIDLGDDDAVAAWRAVKPALAAVMPIARLRIGVSTLFGVSPLMDEIRYSFERPQGINYSVAFAAADNWSPDTGYYLEHIPGGSDSPAMIDWLALAALGLRLNTPAETKAKIRRHREQRAHELFTTAARQD